MFTRILYPTDGSDHARKALHIAAGLARRCDAPVVVMTAFEPLPRDLGSPYLEELMTTRLTAGEALVREASAVLEKEGVAFEEEVLEGPAATAILDVAQTRGCDLIVMGSRGLGRVGVALLGSVSTRVIQEAHCPVLVVR